MSTDPHESTKETMRATPQAGNLKGSLRRRLKLALGSAAATILGLVVGLLVTAGGDGNPGHLFILTVFGVCGWLFWLRRGESVPGTIGICLLIIVFSWPVGLMLRDATQLIFPWW
jgi:hypothetical protein